MTASRAQQLTSRAQDIRQDARRVRLSVSERGFANTEVGKRWLTWSDGLDAAAKIYDGLAAEMEARAP